MEKCALFSYLRASHKLARMVRKETEDVEEDARQKLTSSFVLSKVNYLISL